MSKYSIGDRVYLRRKKEVVGTVLAVVAPLFDVDQWHYYVDWSEEPSRIADRYNVPEDKIERCV